MSNISINGNVISHFGNSIVIQNNRVIVDGKDVTPNEKEINIAVEGNVEELKADACNKIKVSGHCTQVSTMSGDIDCGTINGNAKTMSGNIKASNVGGSVNTMSGNVDCGVVCGSASSSSGNVKYRLIQGEEELAKFLAKRAPELLEEFELMAKRKA